MKKLLLVFLIVGCGAPTAAELQQGGIWSHLARVGCTVPGSCPAQHRCTTSVLVMASDGAGKAEVKAVAANCTGPAIAPPSVVPETHTFMGLDDVIGAVGAAVKVAADKATEYQQVRRAVKEQALGDVAYTSGTPR